MTGGLSAVLEQIQDGVYDERLGAEMERAARAARAYRKPATVTLTLTVAPASEGQVLVTARHTSKLPDAGGGSILLFDGDGGRLSRRAPGQLSLDDVREMLPERLEPVDALVTTRDRAAAR